jgi:hypothetical protein
VEHWRRRHWRRKSGRRRQKSVRRCCRSKKDRRAEQNGASHRFHGILPIEVVLTGQRLLCSFYYTMLLASLPFSSVHS